MIYEKDIINMINNIIYNSTQSDSITKDRVIDSLIGIIRDYNYCNNQNIQIIDWRKSR